jgi:hypothetical protein
MRKRGVEEWSRKKQIELVAFLASIVLALVLLVLRSSHEARRPGGPTRVEADGVTYIACGGAIWVPNNLQTLKDDEPQNYNVKFRDAQGVDRELHRVRRLRITDLPMDAPECANSH